MTEQDKHFLRVMQEHLLHYGQIPKEDVAKLMAMARRPTRKALQDEIERLRTALQECLGWHDYSNDMHKPIEVRAAYMRARALLDGK